ncbi:MAG TPA: dihydrofolate reductase [Gammaproteobacteria bacterium]|nr:dihydrofolate reductase [Gammaproteobacteria bacterium]
MWTTTFTATNGGQGSPTGASTTAAPAPVPASSAHRDAADFRFEAERFGDLAMLRYRVPGFEELDRKAKTLLYYLYEAALSGREIIFDQKYRYNLAIKRTLEEVFKHYPGNRDNADFRALVTYLKRVWFSNGIHHHYSNDKFRPGFDFAALERFVKATPGRFPLRKGQTLDELLAELEPVMFDPAVDAKLVSKGGADVLAASAVNFYGDDISQREVAEFYAARSVPNDPAPVSSGLNSRLVRENGALVEQVWKLGGLYTEALERVVAWLEKARGVAENGAQREALAKLIAFYRSGELRDWDAYNIAWVADTESSVDAINGFVEVYNDPLNMRGSFESVVSFRDPEATKRINAIAAEAQWFEDRMPILERHKKPNCTGVIGRVITVVIESGDAAPPTPVGINLPNADWIRQRYGSKSVYLANIVEASDEIRHGADREFAWDEADAERSARWGKLAAVLHTDMHEVIGHGSGQIDPDVGPMHETLKNYGSTLEEARADLVALYYAIDPKLVELGLMPSVEVGYVEYERYIRGGLQQQLYRIAPGNDVEEDHMRNRQLVAAWAYEHGKPDNVIERRVRDGKTYFVIRDYEKLRELFGRLLCELQRIKSEGDYDAIRDLVERYAVKVDPAMHAEVLMRYEKLDVPAYYGFIGPRLVPVERGGAIVDVRIEYPEDFAGQMLEYAERYAFLPTWS